MQSVLIVEDSGVVLKILRHIANKLLTFDVHFASSKQQALELLKTSDNWLAAVVDLSLPDAPNGELVDEVLKLGIPTIVLTGTLNEDRQEQLTKAGIVDYVFKESAYSYEYALKAVNRLYRNQFVKVLIAEDSKVTGRYIAELLSRHLFQVTIVPNGELALQALIDDPEIKVLLTDYNMPIKDGFELIHDIRHKYARSDLFIIGLSSTDSSKKLSTKFIKNGANDFLYKPFSAEEFYCRVTQGVELVEQIQKVREVAYLDSLTGMYNRQAFYERAQASLQECLQQGDEFSLCLIGLDHFRNINEQFGYDSGDEVIKHFAHLLRDNIEPQGILGRSGGEVFTIALPNTSLDSAVKRLEDIKMQLECESVFFKHEDISYTFSAGVASLPATHLIELFKEADMMMYRAKDAGRNMILSDESF